MFALLGAASPAAAQAQDVAGRFEVRNAYVELADGAWRLDVRLDLALADAARQAFDQGVPLVLGLEAEASVDRRFLPARDVVQLERKWQLAYDAITDRFVVTDATTGEHVSHASQEEALAALSRIKGLGKKTAERIILELKDKVGVTETWQDAAAGQVSAPAADAELALIALGYKQVDARKAVRKALDADPAAATEALVRGALRLMQN